MTITRLLRLLLYQGNAINGYLYRFVDSKSDMFSYLSFRAKSEMVVAVPVYSKDGEKIEILLLVELSG